jgi:hypothetical protein
MFTSFSGVPLALAKTKPSVLFETSLCSLRTFATEGVRRTVRRLAADFGALMTPVGSLTDV